MNAVVAVESKVAQTIIKKFCIGKNIEFRTVSPDIESLSRGVSEDKPTMVFMQADYAGAASAHVRACASTIRRSGCIVIVMSDAADGLTAVFEPDFLTISLNELKNLGAHVERLFLQRRGMRSSTPARRKILFVDDSRVMHNFVTSALDREVYDVLHADHGEQGLELYRMNLPDMIITDIEMPIMNGYDMCRRIKEENENRFIPILVMSSLGERLDVDKAFETGADDYLVKPVTAEALNAKLDVFFATIERKRSSRIVLAEDSKVSRELIRHALIKEGLNVIAVENGAQALESALSVAPEILITDIEMPVMDGYRLCEEIRNRKELESVNILMMSSRDRAADIKRGRALGVQHYFVKPFDMDKLLLVVDRILIEKYHMYHKEAEYLLLSIRSLVKALEARDSYTSGHTERVSFFSAKLGRALGMSGAALADLEIAANLHDIGKIGVRDDILLKEGSLTDEEYMKIQEHAVIGAEILKPISSLKKIIPMILYHHERWDGKGYPNKIKGEEIPIEARIIAIADTYDAITSDRPYRKGRPSEVALSIIQGSSGTQFCPHCAAAFSDMMTATAATTDTH